MGGGKTTVVGPLLALILGDGDTLVIQTMPPALLEQSKATLRATFSSIIRKRIFSLAFDRSTRLEWAMLSKLEAAARTRGVVLCTASTIKSFQLKLLEHLVTLASASSVTLVTAQTTHGPRIEADVRVVVGVLQTFKRSCIIMDEVSV